MNTRAWHWAVAACGVLLAAAAHADEPPLPPELAWVPQHSTAFVHIRFAELWNSPVGRDVVRVVQSLDPKALDEVEKQLGFPLSRLERVTILLPDIVEEGREPGFAFRLTTTRPYNRQDVMIAMMRSRRPGPNPPTNLPTGGDFLRTDDGVLVHFTDDRNITIVTSKEGAVGLLGRFLGTNKAGPLAAALKLAASNNQVVAAVNVTQLPRVPVDQFPPEFKPLRPLFDAKTVTVAGNLGADAAQLQATIAFGSKDDAAEGQTALEEGRKLLLAMLMDAERRVDRDEAGKFQLEFIKEIQNSVKGAKIELRDAALHVSTQLRLNAPVAKVLAEGTGAIRMAASRSKSQNNLKQIGLAMHNYNDVHGALPAAAICDKNGKPLLSWRVAILPYIEQDNLYRQFHLDEPWDSEHNKKLLNTKIPVYMLPDDKGDLEGNTTHYLALVGNDAMFDLRKPTRFAQITDGLSNTLMVVEAANGVPWSKPDDIAYDPRKTPPLGYHFGGTCNVLFGDGSVRALSKKIDEKVLHLLIQRSDGQVIPNIP